VSEDAVDNGCILDPRRNPDFGKVRNDVSARQPRPDGQNPIVARASLTNTAQAWLQCAFASPAERSVVFGNDQLRATREKW
jgi:hypothetical protein